MTMEDVEEMQAEVRKFRERCSAYEGTLRALALFPGTLHDADVRKVATDALTEFAETVGVIARDQR